MRTRDLSLPRLLRLPLSLLFLSSAAWPQAPSPQSRVVEPVNENALVALRGNTHPLAQLQYDRGAAPPDLAMARMLLVLKRSEAQEAALETLLDDQQDLNSPQYHQWLTPDDFGQQFGPSDQDVQTVAAWLRSHGFQIATIGRGRTVIEFSGTAAQVLQAFHTEIHKYTVNGEDHWANASDPQIPAALAPVIAGVNSLHNFRHLPAHHVTGAFSKSRVTGMVGALQTGFSFQNSNQCPPNDCYFVGPYDFATIYNALPLWNATPPIDGTGQRIAIVAESNINPQDVADFRNLFGLPQNVPNIIVDGSDPGLVPDAETEAVLDTEWSGAVAPGATINLIVDASTETTAGPDLAALYAVENNIAPIISESFLQCELFLGTAGNSFQNAIREQAAAQGISFLTAAGDQGSAGCDYFRGNPPAPATHGLTVNGLASSPYGVAIGGTDFLNFGETFNFNSVSPYWNATNDTHQASAKGYVPESTWNSTCTNEVFIVLRYGGTEEASCNNPQASNWVETVAGSGGKSNCISSDGSTPSSCTGGYPKPSWQSTPGIPADNARDIPDVSFFASSGFMGSAYIVCQADQPSPHGSCGLNSLQYDFLGVGGTSVSSPAFAGIMALVNQYTQSAGQGNANYVLYKLASSATQTQSPCNAASVPASACIFYDITFGTIATPCAASSPNCTRSGASDTYGVLNGYNAGTGYDLATGLGSVNAYNLVHAWTPPGTPTTTTLSLNSGNAVNVTHGQSVSFNIAVTPSAATGDVSLIGSPTAGGSVAMGEFTLQNGAASGTTSALAGGTSYQVKAHYTGDRTHAPSDSTSVTVTVAPEPSATLISIPVFDPNTGRETGDTPTTLVYGSPYIERVDVGDAKATVTFPMKQVCAPLTCPTGSVTLTDSLNGGAPAPLGGAGIFPLNSNGYAEYLTIQLPGGQHVLSASYNGDNSYAKSSGTYSLTVTPAPIQITAPGPPQSNYIGSPSTFSVTVSTNVYSAAAPTGTITFYDGATALAGSVLLSGQAGTTTATASLTGSVTANFTTPGTHQISAKYSGDSNYAAATSSALSLAAYYPTNAALTAPSTTINQGDSITITATVTSTYKSPPMTGTFQFTANPAISGPVIPKLSTDADGNQVLTATVITTPANSESILMVYSGDSNYESVGTSIYINVLLPTFSMATAPASLVTTAGQSVSTQLTVTPGTTISSSVALTCNVYSLAGATCAFNPLSPLGLANGASVTTMLTISTLPPSSNLSTGSVNILPADKRRIPPLGLWTPGLTSALAGLVMLWGAGRRSRLVTRLSVVCLLCVVLGCGASSSSGGGGGGGGNSSPTPTTLTLSTLAIKIPSGTQMTFTATLHTTGGKAAAGTVSLLDSGSPIAFSSPINGVATFVPNYLAVGTHMLSAQYQGDSNNQPSTTVGTINQVITGTGSVGVTGTSPAWVNSTSVLVTIQ